MYLDSYGYAPWLVILQLDSTTTYACLGSFYSAIGVAMLHQLEIELVLNVTSGEQLRPGLPRPPSLVDLFHFLYESFQHQQLGVGSYQKLTDLVFIRTL